VREALSDLSRVFLSLLLFSLALHFLIAFIQIQKHQKFFLLSDYIKTAKQGDRLSKVVLYNYLLLIVLGTLLIAPKLV
jgi:hypothetical protein